MKTDLQQFVTDSNRWITAENFGIDMAIQVIIYIRFSIPTPAQLNAT